jgi:hypothetical protein
MQLVIRIVDKPPTGDKAKDALRHGAGDVIDILPDDHRFSKQELSYPEWRIVSVPGMTKDEAAALLAAGIDGSGNLTRKRQVRVDLGKLAEEAAVDLKAERLPGKENLPAADFTIDKASVLTAAQIKPATVEVIGPAEVEAIG